MAMRSAPSRFFFLVPFTTICSTLFALPITAIANEPIRVMSFNIRFDNPKDGENAWPHRRDWVGELILEHQVDVLGLQEALRSQIDDLQERLPTYNWYGVGRDDGRHAGEYAPIFYNADRFELVHGGHFWLCEKPDEPGRKDWESACTRITTWVALRQKGVNGTPTGPKQYFYNTHFDHVSKEARLKSAELIRSRIAAVNDGEVVLTGDFNCTAGSPPIEALVAGADQSPAVLSDAFALGKNVHKGPSGTWNGFRVVKPDARIDFIFVSPGWRVAAHRILDVQRDGRFPSDHCPVLATLTPQP